MRSIVAALGLMLIALFMPRVTLEQKTFDYVVVFDITQSMNVEDYDLRGSPVSRLAFAREAVGAALRRLPCGSRVGWGAFAEYRTILLLVPIEVCANYNDLLASLERIDGRMRWANASEIAKGVYWAMRAARDVGAAANATAAGPGARAKPPVPDVLFLTDGQEAPPVIGPDLPLFDDLTRGQVRGWLVGVGGYTPRRIPRTDDDDKPIGFWHADEVMQIGDMTGTDGPGSKQPTTASREQLSEVREPHLRTLASEVGFEYAHLDDLESIESTMLDPRFARRTAAPADVGWIPALAALLLLAVRFRPRGGFNRGGTLRAVVRARIPAVTSLRRMS